MMKNNNLDNLSISETNYVFNVLLSSLYDPAHV